MIDLHADAVVAVAVTVSVVIQLIADLDRAQEVLRVSQQALRAAMTMWDGIPQSFVNFWLNCLTWFCSSVTTIASVVHSSVACITRTDVANSLALWSSRFCSDW